MRHYNIGKSKKPKQSSLEELCTLIYDINLQERVSTLAALGTLPKSLHYTTLFYGKNLAKVEHVILGVHGFLVTHKELKLLAERMIEQEPNTVFIAFNIPGFHTLIPQEIAERCTSDNIKDSLHTFYKKLVEICSKRELSLRIHGNSFGAQLALDAVWTHYSESESKFLPTGISLLSPFLIPTTAINILLPLVLTIAAAEEYLPQPIRLFTALFNAFMGDQRYTEDGMFEFINSARDTPKIERVPGAVYMILRAMTRQFHQRVIDAGGLPMELREIIHVTMSSRDDVIGGASAISFVKDHIIGSDKTLSHSKNPFHVVDDPLRMPLITHPAANLNWQGEKNPCKLTCVIAQLTLFVTAAHVDTAPRTYSPSNSC